jgi:hypothetical protein
MEKPYRPETITKLVMAKDYATGESSLAVMEKVYVAPVVKGQ